MKSLIICVFFMFGLIGVVTADPLKCLTHGKTLYTDDPAKCQTEVKPIAGNVVISTLPGQSRANQPFNFLSRAGQVTGIDLSGLNLPSALGNLPLPAGISQKDIAAGWQVIMDARNRGTWEAPKMPDDAK